MAAIVMKYNGDDNITTLTAYLDGQKVASRSFNGKVLPFQARDQYTLVGRNTRRGYAFKGYVDELSVFKNAWTDKEIEAAYEIGQR